MEPATAKSYPVAAQKVQLGQAPEQHGWWHWALLATVSLILTGRFAWGVYQARHSPRELAFVIVTYDLVAVLCCCLVKLRLRRQRRWVRVVVWVVSVALAIIIAARVALVMPNLVLKIAVLVITGVGIGLSFYYFFVGRQKDDTALHKVSPEQNVSTMR